jgi:hypothetical protein
MREGLGARGGGGGGGGLLGGRGDLVSCVFFFFPTHGARARFFFSRVSPHWGSMIRTATPPKTYRFGRPGIVLVAGIGRVVDGVAAGGEAVAVAGAGAATASGAACARARGPAAVAVALLLLLLPLQLQQAFTARGASRAWVPCAARHWDWDWGDGRVCVCVARLDESTGEREEACVLVLFPFCKRGF